MLHLLLTPVSFDCSISRIPYQYGSSPFLDCGEEGEIKIIALQISLESTMSLLFKGLYSTAVMR